ncbi:S-adenosyl-L-methionine-dependent methyltransferase [Mycena maculata]|uniref:S-adenosyl-L-methionine-dependent methyltransferase n=1 Tax=Mycena maculata TaxID=230809 RepID=A0AAD7HIE2_9AGAR|nr:S-adenosyl-L-methionine-dependent methyltransferase [Mycena maculata]
MSAIRQLLELITQSVEALEDACQSSRTAIPDLQKPFAPSSEDFRQIPAAAEAAAIISAAALQLDAILAHPSVSLYRIVGGHFKSAALRICLESNVTEILILKGIHVKEIAAKNGQDPQKLARCIRYLATHHFYREIKPNVFANTRISSMLNTGKSIQDILANPEEKHEKTLGVAALAAHHLDEAFKASAYAWETLADPATVRSGDPEASPFARAMGRPETLWKYYERPEGGLKHRRFNIGMQGIEALQPPDAILQVYQWNSLAPNSIIVDVGGGVGTSCLTLAAKYPMLKFVVQDRDQVIVKAKELWNTKMPTATASGQVKLESHDFFKPQPQTTASVFLLKQIMHDWSDEYCVKILTQLWEAATPTTTLLLMDSIIPLACHDPNAEGPNAIPGACTKEAPTPLLANYGGANDMVYNADFDMFLLFNSQERTLTQFVDLLTRTGWKITAVNRQPGDSSFLQSIEAKKDQVKSVI